MKLNNLYALVLVSFLKTHNILDCSASEAVNALVVVTYNANIVIFACEKISKHILCIRSVLILVNNYVLKLVLISFQNIGIFLEKSNRVENHIVKIHCVRTQKFLLIITVTFGNFGFSEIVLIGVLVFSRINKAVFCTAYLRQNRTVIEELVINSEIFLHTLHNTLLVVGVVNCKVLCVAEPVTETAKHTAAHTVESLRPNIVCLRTDSVFKSFFKFACRLVGKGDCKHLPRTGIAVFDDMFNSLYNSCGFARTGTCNNKHRSVNSVDNLLLLTIWLYCVFVHNKYPFTVKNRGGTYAPPLFIIVILCLI